MTKSKRNRLPCREMPFFSGGQNKGDLFADSGHKLLYIMYKLCCICNKILHKKFLQKGQFFGVLIVPKKVMKNGRNGHYSEHLLFWAFLSFCLYCTKVYKIGQK